MRTISYTVCALFIICLPASGETTIEKVASEGQPITQTDVENFGWPDGVIDLLNHPLRSNGWTYRNVGRKNVTHSYAFNLRNPEDLHSIIDQLLEIRSETIRIILYPGNEARSPVPLGGNGTAAVFSIGSEKATTPTLTLYLGHPAISLDTLSIPKEVNVFKQFVREEHDKDLDQAIDNFVAKHKRKHGVVRIRTDAPKMSESKKTAPESTLNYGFQ